ncbi:hypothetical protein FTO74_04555 [Granulicella sp. WH15]|uniref:hypothetical protein n=1 Tax=Granulicella sp. WH15 TaxID=2602070 RepID=UPI0013672F69|nr:hypothetical protein [Granulicella sp. WH15]QHN02721.1 hypothetical protein FTO74_04555 [Granulicella sp. WH15]
MKIHVATLLKSTLALTLAAASVPAVHASPLHKGMHLHPGIDSRICLHVFNAGNQFREIVVEGKTYEVQPHQGAMIKAPAGTKVYAGFNVSQHKKGTVLLELTDEVNGKRIVLS